MTERRQSTSGEGLGLGENERERCANPAMKAVEFASLHQKQKGEDERAAGFSQQGTGAPTGDWGINQSILFLPLAPFGWTGSSWRGSGLDSSGSCRLSILDRMWADHEVCPCFRGQQSLPGPEGDGQSWAM